MDNKAASTTLFTCNDSKNQVQDMGLLTEQVLGMSLSTIYRAYLSICIKTNSL